MIPRTPALLSAALVSLAALNAPAQAEAPKVVASIKPVHSLVASVMRGVGTPDLIVAGAASPHVSALKPSQARMLGDADVVFWIGPGLETFLEKPVASIASKAVSVPLIDAPGLVRLPVREGGTFEAHHHDHADEHEEHEHAEHEHEGHDEHEHEKHAEHEEHAEHEHAAHEEHAEHDEHGHGAVEPHVWLDPANAKAMADAIAAVLGRVDPANAGLYGTNADALKTELDALIGDVDATLAPVRGRGFVVFHDAYRYFEERFGLAATGSITVSPEVAPGAERLREIRAAVVRQGAACVFAEPQFEPRLVQVVTDGTPANAGVLDPLGAALADGPDLYGALIRAMARSFRDCLGAVG